MSEIQAKKTKLNMKISRKTINAIHQSTSAASDFNAFQENQLPSTSSPIQKTPNLRISRKKEFSKNADLQDVVNTSHSSDSNLVDELLADLVINSNDADDILSDNTNNNSSDIFKKLDALDSDDFSITNNDIPVDFESIDRVYGTNNISAIKTIKEKDRVQRTIRSARRGIVKKQPENKINDDKPYYMVVDTDIDYNEIVSRPSKKASEMIDQNSAFFYKPNVFADSDIKYVDVDLSANYGGNYLLEDYLTPDNGLKIEFLGGSNDEEYFKDLKTKDTTPKRNRYILEVHDVDEMSSDVQENDSEATTNTALIRDELLSEFSSDDINETSTANEENETTNTTEKIVPSNGIYSPDTLNAIEDVDDLANINSLGNLDGIGDTESASVFDPQYELKPSDSHKSASPRFASSIFKTFTFDDSNKPFEDASNVPSTAEEPTKQEYIEKAEDITTPVANTQANAQAPVPNNTNANNTVVNANIPVNNSDKSSVTIANHVPYFDSDFNEDYSSIIRDDNRLEMDHLRTSTTFIENDYEDFEMDDSFPSNDLNADYTLDDNSGIDFVDEDEIMANKKNAEENEEIVVTNENKETQDITDGTDDTDDTDNSTSILEKSNEGNLFSAISNDSIIIDDNNSNNDDNSNKNNTDTNDFDVDNLNLDDISLDDLDLTNIDLTDDNVLDSIATPSSQDITEKLTDQFSSLDKDLQDELLSEVLLDSEEDSSLLDGIDLDDLNTVDEAPSKDDQTENTDSDEPIEDNEFYKLISSLSDTITNLENSISMPEPEEVKEKEEVKKTGKAINILINKDDIFSISIENETYDIVADFTDISVISQNINISTPKNNFFTKIGNKYIEIHRKEDSNFVVYTNFEDIEFENAINNITFAKKKDKIELNIKESFKLASIDNKVSLSILNTNIAKIKKPGQDEEDDDSENQNSVCDNDVLTINEETQKVYLPYKIEDVMNLIKNPSNDYHTIKEVVENEYTIPMSTFKPPIVSRFKEAYNFMRTKEKSSVYAALDLALELMFNANLNPAIIRACSNLRELNVYLDCLYENELEKFDCFKIVYKVLPRIQ